MKFSMYKFKAMAPVMALFQKQPLLPFKQDYDNLRLHRQKSALGSDTARSGRCFHRNQSAVSTSHNVPSDGQVSHSYRFDSHCKLDQVLNVFLLQLQKFNLLVKRLPPVEIGAADDLFILQRKFPLLLPISLKPQLVCSCVSHQVFFYIRIHRQHIQRHIWCFIRQNEISSNQIAFLFI